MRKQIYVNRGQLAVNIRRGADETPSVMVKAGGKVYSAFKASWNGPSSIAFSMEDPGTAHVWVETDAEVLLEVWAKGERTTVVLE